MKARSIVLSMAVALFMIAMGNCFAGRMNSIRPVNYDVKISKELFVDFRGMTDSSYLCRYDESGRGIKVCMLPILGYNMTPSDRNLIAFQDDENNVYIGACCQIKNNSFITLYKMNMRTNVFEKMVDIKENNVSVAVYQAPWNSGVPSGERNIYDFTRYSGQIYTQDFYDSKDKSKYYLRISGLIQDDGRLHITKITY